MSNQDDEVVDNNDHFGTMLADARKAQNYTIQDIYENIKVPVAVLTALEAADMDALPAPTFTQGYIRSYAKFLEISEEMAVSSYQQALLVKSSLSVPLHTEAQSKTGQLPISQLSVWLNKKVIIYLSLLIVIIFSLVQFISDDEDSLEEGARQSNPIEQSETQDLQKDQSDEDVLNDLQKKIESSGREMIKIEQNARLTEDGELIVEQTEPVVIDEVETDSEEVSLSENVSLEGASLSELPSGNVSTDTVLNETLPDEMSESIDESDTIEKLNAEQDSELYDDEFSNVVSEVVSEDTISFYAQDGAWLEVWDANEERLFYNMLPEGGRRTLNGRAPFNVFLGNAITTRVEINNIEVDYSARIRTNNTVRFNASIVDEQIKFH